MNFLITRNGIDFLIPKIGFLISKIQKINSKMAPHIPMYLRPSVLL